MRTRSVGNRGPRNWSRIFRRPLPRSGGRSIPQGVSYSIGQFPLRLPRDHALPKHRRRWPLYGKPLELLADAMREVRGTYVAVDVGANVGDTAALISLGGNVPTLCIEGDPHYLPYLDYNAAVIGAHLTVERCFVGGTEGTVDPHELRRRAGTTSFHPAVRPNAAEPTPHSNPLDRTTAAAAPALRRLEAILADHPEFTRPGLIKFDTDGQDFGLLLAHRQLLSELRPVLFFEYDVNCGREGMTLSCQSLVALSESGYARYVLFDNFGNYLLSTADPGIFPDLNLYLRSNARFAPAVYYLDVCAIPAEFLDVAEALKRRCQHLILGAPSVMS